MIDMTDYENLKNKQMMNRCNANSNRNNDKEFIKNFKYCLVMLGHYERLLSDNSKLNKLETELDELKLKLNETDEERSLDLKLEIFEKIKDIEMEKFNKEDEILMIALLKIEIANGLNEL